MKLYFHCMLFVILYTLFPKSRQSKKHEFTLSEMFAKNVMDFTILTEFVYDLTCTKDDQGSFADSIKLVSVNAGSLGGNVVSRLLFPTHL